MRSCPFGETNLWHLQLNDTFFAIISFEFAFWLFAFELYISICSFKFDICMAPNYKVVNAVSAPCRTFDRKLQNRAERMQLGMTIVEQSRFQSGKKLPWVWAMRPRINPNKFDSSNSFLDIIVQFSNYSAQPKLKFHLQNQFIIFTFSNVCLANGFDREHHFWYAQRMHRNSIKIGTSAALAFHLPWQSFGTLLPCSLVWTWFIDS